MRVNFQAIILSCAISFGCCVLLAVNILSGYDFFPNFDLVPDGYEAVSAILPLLLLPFWTILLRK